MWPEYLNNSQIIEKQNFKSLFKSYYCLFKELFKGAYTKLFIGILMSFIFILFTCITPFVTRYLIDGVLINGKIELLYKLLIGIIALWFLSTVFNLLHNYLLINLDQEINYKLKTKFYSHILKLPVVHFNKKHTGDYLYRLFNDSTQISNSIFNLPLNLFLNFLFFVIILLVSILINWKLTVIVLPCAIVQSFITFYFGKKIYNYEISSRDGWEDLQSYSIDRLSNVLLIKTRSEENNEINRFLKEAKNLFLLDTKKYFSIKLVLS